VGRVWDDVINLTLLVISPNVWHCESSALVGTFSWPQSSSIIDRWDYDACLSDENQWMSTILHH